MKKTKTHEVVMLPTEKANENSDSLIFKQTRNVFGAIVDKPMLEFTENKTTIRNIVLQSEKKLATNSRADYNFYHLYFLSDETPKQGDNFIVRIYTNFEEGHLVIGKALDVNKEFVNGNLFGKVHIGNCKKIVATTDTELIEYGRKGIDLPIIPESFVKVYINAFNEGKPITEVELEMERSIDHLPKISELESKIYDAYTIKTRPDNTVIVHQSKLYTKDDIRTVMILKLESLMPRFRAKFGDKFTGTDIYDAIEFGTEAQLLREIDILKRAIKEIDEFLDENL